MCTRRLTYGRALEDRCMSVLWLIGHTERLSGRLEASALVRDNCHGGALATQISTGKASLLNAYPVQVHAYDHLVTELQYNLCSAVNCKVRASGVRARP